MTQQGRPGRACPSARGVRRWPREPLRRAPGRPAPARPPEDVDRSARPPRSRADRRARPPTRPLGLARRGLEVVAQRQRAPPASRSACSPSRARRRPGSARPAISIRRSPSKNTTSIASLAVPAGDHDGAAGRARGRARASARRRARSLVAGEHARLGQVGRHHGRARRRARRAPPARRRRAAARRTRRPSRGRPRPGCPRRQQVAAPRPTASIAGHAPEHPDLDRVDADVLDHGAHLRDDESPATRPGPPSRRPCSAP